MFFRGLSITNGLVAENEGIGLASIFSPGCVINGDVANCVCRMDRTVSGLAIIFVSKDYIRLVFCMGRVFISISNAV